MVHNSLNTLFGLESSCETIYLRSYSLVLEWINPHDLFILSPLLRH